MSSEKGLSSEKGCLLSSGMRPCLWSFVEILETLRNEVALWALNLESEVVPTNQTKGSRFREVSGKESGTGFASPLLVLGSEKGVFSKCFMFKAIL